MCESPFDPSTLKGYIGYGTNPVFGKYCIPDLDEFPTELSDLKEQYNNIVFDYGLDDLQEN